MVLNCSAIDLARRACSKVAGGESPRNWSRYGDAPEGRERFFARGSIRQLLIFEPFGSGEKRGGITNPRISAAPPYLFGGIIPPRWGFALSASVTQGSARFSLHPELAYFGPLALWASLFRAFGPLEKSAKHIWLSGRGNSTNRSTGLKPYALSGRAFSPEREPCVSIFHNRPI